MEHQRPATYKWRSIADRERYWALINIGYKIPIRNVKIKLSLYGNVYKIKSLRFLDDITMMTPSDSDKHITRLSVMNAINDSKIVDTGAIFTSHRTISRDLVVSLIVAVSVVSVLTIAFNFRMLSKKFEQQNKQKAAEYLAYLKGSLELPLWNVDEEGVNKIARSFIKNDLVAKLKIVDSDGNIWFEKRKDESELLKKSGAISHDSQIIGQVELGLTPHFYKETTHHLLLSSLITLLLVIAALVVVTTFLLRVFLKNPLDYLNDRIDRIADGDYEYSTRRYNQKEIETIISKFNDMAAKVESREKSLADLNIKLNREVAERKQAEEALRESEKLYRLLADNVTDVIWVRDMHLNLTYVSPSIMRQTGHTVEETMERTLEDALTFDSLKLVEKIMAEELEIEKRTQKDLFRSRTVELEVKCKDGATIWTEVTMSFIRDRLGNASGIIGVTRDITDRKRLEVQLQQSQRMEAIGTLAGGVAHDLNNILSGIVSYPELILMELPQDSPLRRPIMTIQKSGEKAAVIVQDLLTLARRGVSITEVVNLNHIIAEQLTSPEFEKLTSFHPDVTVKTDFEKALLNIKGSPAHLSKSIMNILSNAAEAMPGGGTIFISTENCYLDRPLTGYDHVERGEYVTVRVTDTGMGIPEKDIKKIFEPFYTKKVMGRSGTGLGMAVVWGTVKDHKGYIDIQSGIEKGSTFTLYFPVTRTEIARDETLLPIDEYKGQGEQILVVDDVAEQREIATGMLIKLGYSAAAVSSGEEAIKYLQTHSVDLLVLDMIMDPGINGLETYRRILEFHPYQKAVIASGFSETDDVKTAQRLGAGEYIKKPYTLEKIGLAVRNELKRVTPRQ